MNKNFSICVYEFYKKHTTSVVFWKQHESVAFLCNTLYNHVGCGNIFFVHKSVRFRIYTKHKEVSVVKQNGRKNEEMK